MNCFGALTLLISILILNGSVLAGYGQVATNAHIPESSAYEQFALKQGGDPAHGRQVFANPVGASCVRCHTTDGSSGRVGPDLFAIADKFSRADIIHAILQPSASIDIGYDTTVISTKDDEDYSGVIKQATDARVDLMGWDGKTFHIATANIRSRTTIPTSFMPAGLQNTMSLQDFADIIAYLETLHQSAAGGGMPEVIPPATRPLTFEPFFGADLVFEHPVCFEEIPGFTNRFVVVEHAGKSWMVERTAAGDKKTTLVDLSHTVRFGGATGLLGLAFHPQFAQNRKYYLKYQILDGDEIYTVVMERKFAADFSGDSGEPGREIIRIHGITQDHNGGCIAFGLDGYLYLGMGDTGPQRDPQGHAQNLKLMLGKMLRIDVDHPADGKAYGIPATNPFRNNPNALPEIWAYGLREPWRFSFDRVTGDLWVGDVGQDRFEEVSLVRAGENEGWNVFEGFTPFSDQYRRADEKYVPPVFSYSHHDGVCVTGGYVYRGSQAPAFQGRYIFGDFEARRLWAITQTNRQLASIVEIGHAPSRFASFGEDSAGELYLVGYDNGIIYKLNLATVDPTPVETKIFAPTAEQVPVFWHFTTQPPATNWFQPAFSNVAWNYGPAGFGSRGTPGAVIRTEWTTNDIWLRREFTIPDDEQLAAAKSITLRVHHDEDAEIYINGRQVASLPHWTSGYTDVPLNPDAIAALHPGRNLLAVHCHQVSGGQYIDAGLMEVR